MLFQSPQLYNVLNSICLSCPTEISNNGINMSFLNITIKSAARLSNKQVIYKVLQFCSASALTDHCPKKTPKYLVIILPYNNEQCKDQ